MNINYKQPQFELFPANSATMDDVDKPKFLLANLTLSIESLVILTILGIMVALFSFSIGVERGKQLSAQALDERVSAAWNLAPKKPALPKAPAVVAAKGQAVQAASPQPVAVAKMNQPAIQAKTTARQAAPVGAIATPTGRFTIQLASYKSKDFAMREALALKAKGIKTFIMKKGDFWLLCSGQFPNEGAAKAAQKKFGAKFSSATLRRL